MDMPGALTRGDDWPDPPGGTAPPDDARVIRRSLGEPEAFSVIFDRHAAQIHRYAARRLGDALAEDVVADTFLAAFRHRDRFDLAHRDALPWLYGIATNLVSGHRRAEVRFYRALARTGVDPVMASPEEEVEARVTAAGEGRRLGAALAGLSAPDRDTLLLVVWGGLSYERAAAALSIPVGTVRSRMNRARRKLRTALARPAPQTSHIPGTEVPSDE